VSIPRNLKQVQEDLRKITVGCAILVGVDQIARAARLDVADAKSSTMISFADADEYFLLLMTIGEEQQLLLSPSTDLIDGHEFPGFDPGLGAGEAPPPVGAQPDPDLAFVAEPDAKCVEQNSKGEDCQYPDPSMLEVGSDGKLRCPFHKYLDPGLGLDPEPDTGLSSADVKLARLEAKGWFGQVLSNDKTEEYLRDFLVRTQWGPSVIEQMIGWLKTDLPFPLKSVDDGLDWLLTRLDRNPTVVQRLKELAGERYVAGVFESKMRDDRPGEELGRLYASLFLADRDVFIYTDDIARRDGAGRGWPLVGQSLRLLGLRLLMEHPNFNQDELGIAQLDTILNKLLKQELTLEDVVSCLSWEVFAPPSPSSTSQQRGSSRRPRSRRGGGSGRSSHSSQPATAQPAPAEPVTRTIHQGDTVDKIKEYIQRLSKAMDAAPPTDLHLKDGDVFANLMVETFGDGTNEDDIREAVQAALDSLEEA